MRRIRPFCFGVFLIVAAFAKTVWAVDSLGDHQYLGLHECRDEALGIGLYCHPDWDLSSEPNSLLLVVSREPYVTLTISRSQEPVFLLTELTDPALRHIGGYAEDFLVSDVVFAGRPAREVIGVSEFDPQTGFLDYYVNYKGLLYHVQFAVKPKAVWPQVEDLILKVRDSLTFMDS